jgi:perosamine synthetase
MLTQEKSNKLKHNSSLAIFGSPKIRSRKFPPYKNIGIEEEHAAKRVLQSGILSKFLGCWHKNFYGGPEVQAFEKEWASFFKVKHAISVNSATSGIYAAIGATQINPGEEVIVTPLSMSISAVAPLLYNAIPVFADIEEKYLCLDPKSIEERITPQTRAIIIVDICGQPYNAEKINRIAKKHNLIVIEDCAQAPGALYKNQFAGTLGDIGIYSLNYHKHIHTGEGGMVVTNNDELAERIRLIRNHAEAVIDGKGVTETANMLGFNFRMTEIDAAIGREQLKKLPSLIKERVFNVTYLENKLRKIPCLEIAPIREHATHVYYVHPIFFNEEIAGISKHFFVKAIQAELEVIENREDEGVRISSDYGKPLYLQSIYQKKSVYGSSNFPWNSFENGKKISYEKGICPTAEHSYEKSLIVHELMRPGMSKQDLDDVAAAFEKVWLHRKDLECLKSF